MAAFMQTFYSDQKKTSHYTARALAIFKESFNAQFIKTPDDRPATVDGVIVKDDQIVAFAEIKCRTFSLEKFKVQYNMEWLITASKLERGAKLAADMGVSLVAMLYLIPDDILFVIKVSEPTGEITVKHEIRETETQVSQEGGSVIRRNAFIDMSKAKMIDGVMLW